MNSHMITLDEKVCNAIHHELYGVLKSLGVSYVLDLDGFEQEFGYSPCISSVFLVGKDPFGSYETILRSGDTLRVKNGSLSGSVSPTGKESHFSTVGTKYYSLLSTETN